MILIYTRFIETRNVLVFNKNSSKYIPVYFWAHVLKQKFLLDVCIRIFVVCGYQESTNSLKRGFESQAEMFLKLSSIPTESLRALHALLNITILITLNHWKNQVKSEIMGN